MGDQAEHSVSNDHHFIEYAIGSPANRGKVGSLRSSTGEFVASPWGDLKGVELYHSLYSMDGSLADVIREYGSVKMYRGTYALRNVVFDIDPENGSGALERSKDIVEQLLRQGWKDQEISVWFSGRGFHILAADRWGFSPSRHLPGIVQATLSRMFTGFDTIYDGARLIRAQYSLNPKTNLYKIPLTLEQFGTLALKEIKLLANQSPVDSPGVDCGLVRKNREVSADGSLRNLPPFAVETQQALSSDVLPEVGRTTTLFMPLLPERSDHEAQREHGPGDGSPRQNAPLHHMIDTEARIARDRTSTEPTGEHSTMPHESLHEYTSIVTCMQKAHAQPPQSGQRHQTMLRMASAWRRGGLTPQGVFHLLRQWADADISSKEITDIIDSIYKGKEYSCHDPIMVKYCDPRCVFYKNKNLVVTTSAENMEERYAQYVRMGEEGVLDLATLYRLRDPFKIFPGELVILTGDTGKGKTAFLQNVIVQQSLPTLYLSLEVHESLIYRRFAQIAHGLTKDQVRDHYRNGGGTLSGPISHIKGMFISPDLDSLRRVVGISGAKIIVVDTIDGILVPGAKSENEQLVATTLALRELAQSQATIVFAIQHISKTAAFLESQGVGLGVHSGKGSSTPEQKSDKVLVLGGEVNSPYRTVKTMKARDEAPFEIQFKYDINTFRFVQF